MSFSLVQPLVELSGVSVRRGPLPLHEVNFSLHAGEHWLITGENGSGKSTLLGLLRGDLAPSSGTRRYFLDGAWRVSPLRARVQLPLVSPEQEAFYLQRDVVQTVADVLLSGLSGERLNLWQPEASAQARLAEVSALLHLTELLTRDIRTLSHGQRRRTLLGRALMPRPAALLLDELTDGLSVAARQELGEVLRRVAAHTALVLVTHRPEEAPPLDLPLAWRRAHLAGGRLTLLDKAAEAPPAPAAIPTIIWPSPPEVSPQAEPLVVLEHAEVYRNGHHALGPIDWQWQAGQHWLVTGENGAGKSTLARLVVGELHAAVGGRVTRPFLHRDLRSERAQNIGLLGAEVGIRQRRDWTGYAVLASGFAGSEGFAPVLDVAQQARLQEVAAQLEVLDLLERSAETLSQGQLRRLLLGRAIIHRPRLLILDEGVDFLDEASRQRFWALLPELVAGGTHLLVVSHREADVPPGLTHHLYLSGGLVTAVGPRLP